MTEIRRVDFKKQQIYSIILYINKKTSNIMI